MRVFVVKDFRRFQRKERIEDEALCEAIARAERGLIDADLGGGLIKQRVARQGQGRSGGYRTIIAYQRGDRCVFLRGFAKSRQANIGSDDQLRLTNYGRTLIALDEGRLGDMLEDGELTELDWTD